MPGEYGEKFLKSVEPFFFVAGLAVCGVTGGAAVRAGGLVADLGAATGTGLGTGVGLAFCTGFGVALTVAFGAAFGVALAGLFGAAFGAGLATVFVDGRAGFAAAFFGCAVGFADLAVDLAAALAAGFDFTRAAGLAVAFAVRAAGFAAERGAGFFTGMKPRRAGLRALGATGPRPVHGSGVAKAADSTGCSCHA